VWSQTLFAKLIGYSQSTVTATALALLEALGSGDNSFDSKTAYSLGSR
jgi:hypothetical protein